MAIENTATLTLEYEDGSTRNVGFTDIATSALPQIKTRALLLNETIADSVQGAAYRETFISDTGEPLKRIKAAKYVITNEQVIYNG